MTYLDLCNQVLLRMREDPMAATAVKHDDEIHDLVCAYVNDAKDLVEDAWKWSNLWMDIPFTAGAPGPGVNTGQIMSTGEGAEIRRIYLDGRTIRTIPVRRWCGLKV